MTLIASNLRRMFRSLNIRNYRVYFFGQIISMIGTWTQVTAQMWLVLQLSGSAVAMGITAALQFLPVLLAGAWGGVLADRADKRKVLIATQGAGASLALVLAVLTLTGVVELWMVYVLAFLFGVVLVADHPVRQSFVMEMVGPEDLPNAVGLNSTVFTTARIVGPALAAILISTAGIGWAFMINAASYLAVIRALRAMRVDELRRAERVERAKGQLVEGLRYVWSTPLLRSSLLLMAVVGTLAFNFRVLLPLMAEVAFNGDAGTYGLLSSTMGGGTFVGALIATWISRPTRALLVGAAFTFGILIVAAGAAPSLPLELVALFLLGAASIVFIATANSTLQLNSTDAMRGRVMALYSVVFLGSTPIGSPLVGLIAEHFGPRAALLVAGVATILGGVVALRGLRRARAARAAREEPKVTGPAGISGSLRRWPMFGQRK